MIELFIEIGKSLILKLKSLSIEHITLISIFVSFIIYSLGKHNELKMRKHNAKRENYLKFLELHIKIFKNAKDNKEFRNKQLLDKFYDVGSSLLSYGSKKLYKQYLFYREITINPIIDNSKYYSNDMNLYLLGGILKQIRKELALEKKVNINENEALSFFVNGFTNNPISKAKLSEMKYKIRMLKLELFFYDRLSYVWMKKFYYFFVASIFSSIKIIFRFLVMIPMGKFITKRMPRLYRGIQKLENEKNSEDQKKSKITSV